ncbi:MAG TPA: type I-B CRISPR-associated protein Cas7/Csh2 [Spirochaetota bacterium]|nr:type I-B CRISPR-associated protein Cas7/Csh2 [Spirochaetota bacterium]HPY88149.1 type I-B CRISPR-associated protein Cas7/Csh2 [Spirochaetota bacterium]HQB60142.1 type I-B CRISPR-associated protein Cas7/Csh2 [Spirochaetota bacterium]
MEVIKNRMELLFLYDVKDGNPNGDPMDENKPRIDDETKVNFVTDVRLKRTIRDYLYKFKGYDGTGDKDIFCRQTEMETGGLKDGKNRALDYGKKKEEMLPKILKSCIDIRLFGGVIPLDKDSITFTGPVQFKMGRSLHRVELNHIKGTGAFASKAGANQQTFREEYVLPYSLIAFYGVINENAAKETGLSDNDVEELLEGMWNGTKNLLSRSKMEHNPRLLLKIKHKKENFFIGELDKLITLEKELPDEKLRDISEVKINLKLFSEKIKKIKDNVEKIEIVKDDRCIIVNYEEIKDLINLRSV